MTNYDPIAPTHAFTHQHGGDDPLPMTIWDFYEIGDIHITTTMPDPIPQGWELIAQDRVLIGAGTTYDPEDTGGAASAGPLAHNDMFIANHTPTLTHSSEGEHDHAAGTPDFGAEAGGSANVWRASTDSALGGEHSHDDHTPTITHDYAAPSAHSAFSILPPYFAVYFFRRVS